MTLVHPNVGTLTIYNTSFERDTKNKIGILPEPDFDSGSSPTIMLINNKSFNNTVIVKGAIVYDGTNNPQDDLDTLYQMQYDNRSEVTLTWRGKSYLGSIEKVNHKDVYYGDHSELTKGEVVYEIMFSFVEGQFIS